MEVTIIIIMAIIVVIVIIVLTFIIIGIIIIFIVSRLGIHVGDSDCQGLRKCEGAGQSVVRFPNCHECQLGFQYPKKLEIGKQCPVVEKNYIAAVAKLCRLTSSVSQEKMSAKKSSPMFMVSRLEDQTYPPGNIHFGWRPLKMK